MIKSLWMLVASLLFALMAAFARMDASDFSALELVFYRSAFGAAVIALWVWAQGFTLRTPLVRAHFMRSFLGTFALTIWFYAISKLPLGTAMTLNYTSPLYMALIVIFLAVKNGESFSRASAAAVVLGFFGVSSVSRPASSRPSPTSRSASSAACRSQNGESSSTSRSSARSGDSADTCCLRAA